MIENLGNQEKSQYTPTSIKLGYALHTLILKTVNITQLIGCKAIIVNKAQIIHEDKVS
ncbi:MAG: hypothetical protein IS860_08415 [Nitrosopumilus sp.]|nr:hypothetical protein [Nitrosopumilus sp.]